MTTLTSTELELLKEMLFGDTEEGLSIEELAESGEMLNDFIEIIAVTNQLEKMKESFHEKYLSDLDD